jgi:hypothetical protein
VLVVPLTGNGCWPSTVLSPHPAGLHCSALMINSTWLLPAVTSFAWTAAAAAAAQQRLLLTPLCFLFAAGGPAATRSCMASFASDGPAIHASVLLPCTAAGVPRIRL